MSDSFATPWTVSNQPHLFMGFPRQEYWNGLLFPSPRDLHDSGIKFTSFAFPALAGVFFTTEPQGIQFSHSVMFNSVIRWTAAHPASLIITNSQSLLKLMSIDTWCHPTISSSVIAFSSHLQSFPASGPFPMSRLFSSSGQSIGASTSVLPMNIQGWFPLGLTRLISLLSRDIPESSPAP